MQKLDGDFTFLFSLSSFSNAAQQGIDQNPGRPVRPGNGSDATTGEPGPGGVGPGGPNSPTQIHLWSNFYGNSPETQGYILWHEETHRYFALGDYPSDDYSKGNDFNTQFGGSGYPGGSYGSTANFTDWLQGGCPK